MKLPPIAILFRELVNRRVKMTIRYPLNALAAFGNAVLFYLLLLAGGLTFGGSQFESNIGTVIITFYLWSLTNLSFKTLSQMFTAEASEGTLQQLYVTPFGIRTVSLVLLSIAILDAAFWAMLTLGVIALVSGEPLLLDPFSIVPLSLFAIAPATGLGFVAGGLAIVYKRVSALFGILRYTFIGFIALALSGSPLLKFVPIADGAYLLLLSIRDGKHIWELDPVWLIFLVVKAVLFVGLGLVIFDRIVDRAREKGVLGHY